MRVCSWGVGPASRDNFPVLPITSPRPIFSKVTAMPVRDIEIEIYRQRRAGLTKSLRRHYKQMAWLREKIADLEKAQRALDLCEVELFERYNATPRSLATRATTAIAK